MLVRKFLPFDSMTIVKDHNSYCIVKYYAFKCECKWEIQQKSKLLLYIKRKKTKKSNGKKTVRMLFPVPWTQSPSDCSVQCLEYKLNFIPITNTELRNFCFPGSNRKKKHCTQTWCIEKWDNSFEILMDFIFRTFLTVWDGWLILDIKYFHWISWQ